MKLNNTILLSLLSLCLCFTQARASVVDDLYIYTERHFQNRGLELYHIPVCWHSSAYSELKEVVKEAVNASWGAHAQIKFTGWNNCPSGRFHGIRIQHEDLHSDAAGKTEGHGMGTWNLSKPGMYLEFGGNSGCYSKPGMNLKKCTIQTAVHEFGHALSFVHEQQHPDTPSSCLSKTTTGSMAVFTPYDEYSAINYCAKARPNGELLSKLDILTLQTYYDNIPALYRSSKESDIKNGTIILPNVQIDGGADRYFIRLEQNAAGEFEIKQQYLSDRKSNTLVKFDGRCGVADIPMVKVLEYKRLNHREVDRVTGLYAAQLKQLVNGNFSIIDESVIDVAQRREKVSRTPCPH